MLSLFRGFMAGLLALGVAASCLAPAQVGAQDKKDFKKEVSERSRAFSTSDGLSLKGYWFQGVAIDKQQPDAVLMMPAPGNKITESWIWLAKALSEKNFSVLLFDWRGVGLNGPEGVGSGVGILEDKTKFWNEVYNGSLLMKAKNTIEQKGIDYKYVSRVGNSQGSYRDFMFMNDLQGARLFLDKQSDAGRCNTNRVWIISEKEGAHMGMAFIAAEFQRNTIYDPKNNIFDTNLQFRSAGKDYAGIMALSYSSHGPMSVVANKIFYNALPNRGANAAVRDAKEHLSDRLAMVLMYKKGDSQDSQTLLRSVGAVGPEAELKSKFKYPKEFDIKAKVAGIDMIDPSDSFKVREYVILAMQEISKKQPFGKVPTEREASKMILTPRFPVEKFTR